MLAKAARLRTADEFRTTVRRGVRCGRPTLVLHMLRTDTPPSRAGFVVSKAVGNAVTRNRVKRQLRHLVADRLRQTPFALDVVVRALPHPGPVAADLDAAWEVLAEAVQTVMRRHGLPNPYEQLKALTRGQGITAESMRAFVQGLELPTDAKQRLLEMTPGSYTGLAESLAKKI